MSTPLRLLLRSAIGLVVAGVALASLAATAGASTHDVEEAVDVHVPALRSDAVSVGDVRVAREATAAGERIVVEVTAPEGFLAVSVCVADAAFTRPAPLGRCEFRQGPGEASRYELAVAPGSEHHVQARVATRGGVAWAGWQAGPPAYGSVAVPWLVEDPEDPPLEPPVEQIGPDASASAVVLAVDDGVEDPEPPLPEPVEGCGVDEAASSTALAASTGAGGVPAACAGRDAPGRPGSRA